MIQIVCPHCRNKITARGKSQTITCSNCNRQFVIRTKAKPPRPDAAPAKAAAPTPAARKPAGPKSSAAKVAPAKVAPAKVAPVKAAPLAAKPVKVATAQVTPAPAVPRVQAGPPALRRMYGHPRRKKNNSAVLISSVLMVGLALVGGVFAYVMMGSEREQGSQLATTAPTTDDPPVNESSPDTDAADVKQAADPVAEQQEPESQDDLGSPDDAASGDHGEGDESGDSAGQDHVDGEKQPVADPTSGESDEPAANSGEEDPPAPTDAPIADKPQTAEEPAVEPDPAAEVEPVVPATEVAFEEADKVLRDIMSHWNARTPFATAVTAADHIATFDVPEWEKRDYHLDKYEIDHEDQFESKTEQRFRVSMYFIDQDAEPIISRLYSLTVNAEGRWVIARIKKPKPDLRDAPRADIF